MKAQNRWIILFIIVLLMVSLACRTLLGDDDTGSDDLAIIEPTAVDARSDATPTSDETSPADTATPVPDLEPTAEPGAGEPSGDSGDAPPSLNLSEPGVFGQPEDFASYAINMVITFDGVADDGSSQSSRIELAGVRVLEPPASSMTINIEGADQQAPFDSFTLFEVDNTTYISMPDGSCLGGDSAGMADSFDELLEIQDILEEEVELIESGVMVNGVLADRYSIDQENLNQSQAVDGGFSEIEEASIAVARDGRFVVQVIVDGKGQGGFFESGGENPVDVRYEFNLTPSNEVVAIELPDGCGGSGGGEAAYPMMADAYQVNSFAGILTYLSNSPVTEVEAFYRQAMVDEGWSLTEEFVIEELATFEFSRDGQTAQITIVADNTSDATIVTIISE